MTDSIVIVIAVIFAGVLLDGLRRKWKERRNRVVMKLDKQAADSDLSVEDESLLFKSELPNGGARTVDRSSGSVSYKDSPSRKTSTKDVPVLMDAVELEEEHIDYTNHYVDNSSVARAKAPGEEIDKESFTEARVEESRYGNQDDDSDEEDEFIDGLDEEFLDDVSPVRTHSRNTAEAEDELEEKLDDEWEDDVEDEWGIDHEESDEFDDHEEWDDNDTKHNVVAEDRDDYVDDPDEKWSRDDYQDADEDQIEAEEIPVLNVSNNPNQLSESEESEEYEAYEEYAEYEDDFAGDDSRKQYLSASAGREPHLQDSADRIEPGFGGEELQSYELDEDFNSSLEDEDEKYQESQKAKKRKSVFTAGFLSRKDQGELFRDDYSKQEREDAEPEIERNDVPQEVIIINVMSRPGELFEGFDLLPILQLQGLRLGDMSIFHKYAGSNGTGAVLFSMANMVKPGSFDIAGMENFSTPGISFFLQMPNKQGNMHCFDQMLAAATAVKNSLEGELKDENRSVFTRQTLEHYRQRIQDFELSMLSRK